MDLQVVVAWPRPTTVMNGAFVWAEMDTSEMAPFIYIQLQSGRGHVCNPMVRAGKVSLPVGQFTPVLSRSVLLKSYQKAIIETLVSIGDSAHETRDSRGDRVCIVY